MRRTISSAGSIATFTLLSACAGAPGAEGETSSDLQPATGLVFTLTNDPAGNAVLMYDRAADGSLSLRGALQTGGAGSATGLGSEGALAMSRDGRWLFAVNAGSNDLSVLHFRGGRSASGARSEAESSGGRRPDSLRPDTGGFELADIVPTGGDRPVSVAERNGLVYVVNAGTSQSISGFRVGDDLRLHPIAGSTRPLSAATAVGAAQIAFTPAGDVLVVTEKATNRIVTYVLADDGTPSAPIVTASSGDTPFGFDFDARGTLVVSDAFGGQPGQGAVTSYRLDAAASPRAVTAPVANGQGAPCWVAVTPLNHFAFVANTGSGTISTYDLHADGAVRLSSTAPVGDGTRPADLALTPGGRFLYVLNPGTGTIAGFQVALDGTLTPAPGGASGLPAHPAGLVAR